MVLMVGQLKLAKASVNLSSLIADGKVEQACDLSPLKETSACVGGAIIGVSIELSKSVYAENIPNVMEKIDDRVNLDVGNKSQNRKRPRESSISEEKTFDTDMKNEHKKFKAGNSSVLNTNKTTMASESSCGEKTAVSDSLANDLEKWREAQEKVFWKEVGAIDLL